MAYAKYSLLACLAALLFLSAGAQSQPLYSGGQWDFENGFYSFPQYDRIGTVGNGWRWWSDKLLYDNQYFGFGSHNENKNPDNVSRGIRSQEITMTCATGWAGMYRTITVPANRRIRIQYDARTTYSETPALIFTGTNISGATDFAYNSASTVWHPWGGEPGPWKKVIVTVVSAGTRLTVFIAERHEYPSCQGATFLFDNVEVFDDGPAATPTPTLTPTPRGKVTGYLVY